MKPLIHQAIAVLLMTSLLVNSFPCRASDTGWWAAVIPGTRLNGTSNFSQEALMPRVASVPIHQRRDEKGVTADLWKMAGGWELRARLATQAPPATPAEVTMLLKSAADAVQALGAPRPKADEAVIALRKLMPMKDNSPIMRQQFRVVTSYLMMALVDPAGPAVKPAEEFIRNTFEGQGRRRIELEGESALEASEWIFFNLMMTLALLWGKFAAHSIAPDYVAVWKKLSPTLISSAVAAARLRLGRRIINKLSEIAIEQRYGPALADRVEGFLETLLAKDMDAYDKGETASYLESVAKKLRTKPVESEEPPERPNPDRVLQERLIPVRQAIADFNHEAGIPANAAFEMERRAAAFVFSPVQTLRRAIQERLLTRDQVRSDEAKRLLVKIAHFRDGTQPGPEGLAAKPIAWGQDFPNRTVDTEILSIGLDREDKTLHFKIRDDKGVEEVLNATVDDLVKVYSWDRDVAVATLANMQAGKAARTQPLGPRDETASRKPTIEESMKFFPAKIRGQIDDLQHTAGVEIIVLPVTSIDFTAIVAILKRGSKEMGHLIYFPIPDRLNVRTALQVYIDEDQRVGREKNYMPPQELVVLKESLEKWAPRGPKSRPEEVVHPLSSDDKRYLDPLAVATALDYFDDSRRLNPAEAYAAYQEILEGSQWDANLVRKAMKRIGLPVPTRPKPSAKKKQGKTKHYTLGVELATLLALVAKFGIPTWIESYLTGLFYLVVAGVVAYIIPPSLWRRFGRWVVSFGVRPSLAIYKRRGAGSYVDASA